MKTPFVDHHILLFLQGCENSSQPIDLLLKKYFTNHRSLGAKDRREMAEKIYKMARWKSLLERVSSDKREQLRFLTRFLKEGKKIIPASFPEHVKLGASSFLLEAFCSSWGELKGKELLEILNTEAPVTVRVNAQKISREALLQRWKPRFSVAPCKNASFGIRFAKREPLFSSAEFKEGLFEVQDEGSQEISELIAVKPGDLVLDYCSGSGGKTLAFAHKMEGRGQIFLHDIRPLVLKEAKKRLKRAGIQNAQCLSPEHPQLKKLRNKCRWVLTDVPCSGTGTFRRNPDQKWKLSQKVLENLVAEQKKIVQQALEYLSSEGYLVYITCSLLKEENEEQAAFFAKEFGLKREKTLSLLPEQGGRDGFFAAIFKKKNPC